MTDKLAVLQWGKHNLDTRYKFDYFMVLSSARTSNSGTEWDYFIAQSFYTIHQRVQLIHINGHGFLLDISILVDHRLFPASAAMALCFKCNL